MRNKKGLTLIEVVASITLLSIILLSFVSFFTNASRFNGMSDDRIQAMNIAREQQALVKTLSTEEIYDTFATDTHHQHLYTQQTTIDPYTVTTTIDKTAELGHFYHELHKVQIQVTKDATLLCETYTYYEGKVSP